ncbi:MAG: hypothetical protein WBA10_15075, partial [Elainellaceae cyanobacterium]
LIDSQPVLLNVRQVLTLSAVELYSDYRLRFYPHPWLSQTRMLIRIWEVQQAAAADDILATLSRIEQKIDQL